VRQDPVTFAEALAIVMPMLGYDRYQLEFVGTYWRGNVLNHALMAGLFTEDFFHLAADQPLTRAEFALLFYQAIHSSTVTVKSGEIHQNNDIFLNSVMHIERLDGTVINNDQMRVLDIATPRHATTLFTPAENGSDIFEGKPGRFVTIANSPTSRNETLREATVWTRITNTPTTYTFGSIQMQNDWMPASVAVSSSVPHYINYTLCVTANLSPHYQVDMLLDSDGNIIRIHAHDWHFATVNNNTLIGARDGSVLYSGNVAPNQNGDHVFFRYINTLGGTSFADIIMPITTASVIRGVDMLAGTIRLGDRDFSLSQNPQTPLSSTLDNLLSLTGTWIFTLCPAEDIIYWIPENQEQNLAMLVDYQQLLQENGTYITYITLIHRNNQYRTYILANDFAVISRNTLIAYAINGDYVHLFSVNPAHNGFTAIYQNADISFNPEVITRLYVNNIQRQTNANTGFFIYTDGLWSYRRGTPSAKAIIGRADTYSSGNRLDLVVIFEHEPTPMPPAELSFMLHLAAAGWRAEPNGTFSVALLMKNLDTFTQQTIHINAPTIQAAQQQAAQLQTGFHNLAITADGFINLTDSYINISFDSNITPIANGWFTAEFRGIDGATGNVILFANDAATSLPSTGNVRVLYHEPGMLTPSHLTTISLFAEVHIFVNNGVIETVIY